MTPGGTKSEGGGGPRPVPASSVGDGGSWLPEAGGSFCHGQSACLWSGATARDPSQAWGRALEAGPPAQGHFRPRGEASAEKADTSRLCKPGLRGWPLSAAKTSTVRSRARGCWACEGRRGEAGRGQVWRGFSSVSPLRTTRPARLTREPHIWVWKGARMEGCLPSPPAPAGAGGRDPSDYRTGAERAAVCAPGAIRQEPTVSGVPRGSGNTGTVLSLAPGCHGVRKGLGHGRNPQRGPNGGLGRGGGAGWGAPGCMGGAVSQRMAGTGSREQAAPARGPPCGEAAHPFLADVAPEPAIRGKGCTSRWRHCPPGAAAPLQAQRGETQLSGPSCVALRLQPGTAGREAVRQPAESPLRAPGLHEDRRAEGGGSAPPGRGLLSAEELRECFTENSSPGPSIRKWKEDAVKT